MESHNLVRWNAAKVDSRVSALSFPSVGDLAAEFSWSPCWACRRPLGGERHELRHVDGGKIFVEAICFDCAGYLANDTLPEGGEA